MDSVYAPWLFAMGVSPFGYPRINAYLQLPVAFRSLSRPSSAPDAKAFTLCSSSLELSVHLSVLACSLNCLSFINKLGNCRSAKVFLYTLFHLFGEIVLPFFWKDQF